MLNVVLMSIHSIFRWDASTDVIAIALGLLSRYLHPDEPTTALDVTIQAQIIDLLKPFQKNTTYSCLYHPRLRWLQVLQIVAVMYAGEIVEFGKVEEIFYDPKHHTHGACFSSLPHCQPQMVIFTLLQELRLIVCPD